MAQSASTTGVPHPGVPISPSGWQQGQSGQQGQPGQYAPLAAYGQPAQYGQPEQQPGQPGYQDHPGDAGTSGRLAKGLFFAAGAVVLALSSGVVGGLVAHQASSSQPTKVVTQQAAPVVDRSSVAAVADKVTPSVVDITTGEGEGSGVILTADGSILTNNHVVATATGGSVTVTFSNGKTAKATIVGTDEVGDIAVIKAQNVSGLTPAKFGDSDALHIGDTVLALGSPLGLQGSVTEGIVSALNRPVDTSDSSGSGSSHPISDAIQTDAAINPGNSGGALVNLNGEVIGINTAIATSGQGSGSIGLGFAIPSNKAKSEADQLMSGGKVSHPYMGVQVGDGDGGALISSVVSGGPAEKGGLAKGDLVTKIGTRVISKGSDLVAAVQDAKPGDQLQLTVTRNGTQQQITVTLGTTP
jgi:putative serine protease PepD